MRFVLVRHAEAVEKKESDRDEQRPLTERGHLQARSLAAALRVRGIEIGAVATSPLVRARETADGLVEGLKPSCGEVSVCPLLAPDEWKPRKLSRFLAGLGADVVAAVGHMPDLGTYLEWLVDAEEGSLPMEKAGAACVEFDDAPERGAGRLLWLVTPDWFLPPVKTLAE